MLTLSWYFLFTCCWVCLVVAVPGNPDFISFKNSLQECCQKQQLPVPSYTTWKNSFGYSGKVEVANSTFKSTGVQGERKEAEQGAAYSALMALGLIDASVKFDVKTAAGIHVVSFFKLSFGYNYSYMCLNSGGLSL